MPLVKEDRLIKKVTEMARCAVSTTGRALGIKPQTPPRSLYWHLSDPMARKALQVIIGTLDDRHRERLMGDLRTMNPSPLSRYIVYMAFLERVSPPVRPLALHLNIGDWLLGLPIEETRYYPADPCWQCGYRYPGSTPGRSPGSAGFQPAPETAFPPHPWAGRPCLYCGGEIVNHLAWLGTRATRSLSDFQNAPYRTKQQSMASKWRHDLDHVEPFVVPPSGGGAQIASNR